MSILDNAAVEILDNEGNKIREGVFISLHSAIKKIGDVEIDQVTGLVLVNQQLLEYPLSRLIFKNVPSDIVELSAYTLGRNLSKILKKKENNE